MEKKSFVLYMSWKPAVMSMTDEQAGELFKAIYDLQSDPDKEVDDPSIKYVFEIIKETMLRDGVKYEATREKRKEAIKARWNKSDTNEYKSIQMNTNEYKTIQNHHVSVSESVSDSVSVSDKDNLKEKNIKKEKRFSPPSLEDVKAYCRERNNSVDPDTFIDFYTSKGWKVGNQPMKDWKAAVRTWERNRGTKTPEKKPDKIHNFAERDYDFDALTREFARN